ncbi:hypothetical protein [Phaeodactylibacter xiamenensis]|uniref:hypothetical protein n=1 Tax=Phaeodactylibacter xiamenensis TaxID=1524460 RepID=UPI003BA990F5
MEPIKKYNPPIDVAQKLFENGIDFIIKSLVDFENKDYKYSIIHFSSGIEVLLKAIIAQEDWKLVVKPSKKSTPDKEKLIKGEAKTISAMDCLSLIQSDLKLDLKNGGESFRQLAFKRNEAIHFYIVGNKSGIEILQYNAFEDLWHFLVKKKKKEWFDKEQVKSLLASLGNQFRKENGNLIDDFIDALDKRNDELKSKINQFIRYRKGVAEYFYFQCMSLESKGSSRFVDWKDDTLGAICKLQKSWNRKAKAPRLIYGQKGLTLDKYGNEEGHIICEIEPNKNFAIDYLAYLIEVNSTYFRRRVIGHVVPMIYLNDIRYLPIKVPSPFYRKKILGFLGSLDRKIELLDKQLKLQIRYERGLKEKMFV